MVRRKDCCQSHSVVSSARDIIPPNQSSTLQRCSPTQHFEVDLAVLSSILVYAHQTRVANISTSYLTRPGTILRISPNTVQTPLRFASTYTYPRIPHPPFPYLESLLIHLPPVQIPHPPSLPSCNRQQGPPDLSISLFLCLGSFLCTRQA
jgi:hypothetical protein